MSILLPDSLVQAPNRGARPVAARSFLRRSLEYLFLANSGLQAINLVTGERGAISGTPVRVAAPPGLAWATTTGSNYFTWNHSRGFTYPMTCFALASVRPAVWATGGLVSIGKYAAGVGGWGIYQDTNFSSLDYPSILLGTVKVSGAANPFNAGRYRMAVVVSASQTDHKLYIDGTLVTTSTTSGPSVDNTFTVGLHVSPDPGSPTIYKVNNTSITPLAGIFSRALSAAEVFQLSRNPWQLFDCPWQELWGSGSTGGGSSTITASSSSLLQKSGQVTAEGGGMLSKGTTISAGGSALLQQVHSGYTVGQGLLQKSLGISASFGAILQTATSSVAVQIGTLVQKAAIVLGVVGAGMLQKSGGVSASGSAIAQKTVGLASAASAILTLGYSTQIAQGNAVLLGTAKSICAGGAILTKAGWNPSDEVSSTWGTAGESVATWVPGTSGQNW